ncbi:hypothetical protein [Paenisporosarcina quisquiliarum]|uniref:hypothetical protein n=1 Tax=Paenisporosarcina quisquiliarum TaxID=365346 RepID=UPI003734CA82
MGKIEVKNLFVETEKVVAAYQEKVNKLDRQERELNAELNVLQEEMTSNILNQEGATISELVYLKISAKEIVQKTEIIKVLLEELAEERTALKLQFTPIYRTALRTDIANRNGRYNANDIVERHRYEMLKEIAGIGKQMQKQYFAIAEDIYEVFEDSEVKTEFPRLEYAFNQELFMPSFGWFGDSVVSKKEVFNATRGYLPEGVKEPKEKDVL